MDKNNVNIIVSAFKSYLEHIYEKYKKNFEVLKLRDYELKEGNYHDFITFNIYMRGNYQFYNEKIVHKVIDEIYKFKDFNTLFTTERDTHFYFVFVYYDK